MCVSADRSIAPPPQHRYPEITDEQAAPIIGSFVFQRFLKPAILYVLLSALCLLSTVGTR